jgi:hypothetical protein
MGYMVQFLVMIPIIAVLAFVVLGYLWWRQRKKDKRQLIIMLTTGGTIDMRDLKCELDTARDPDESGAWWRDIDGYRRRASGKHEMALICHQSSAIPAYPGEPTSFRNDRIKWYNSQMTSIAEAWADRDTENIPRLEARANNHQLYKIAIIGTVVIVLIIGLIALLFSGRLHWPF